MPLTNTQHDAIMRIYDGLRAQNQHIQEQRYNEVLSLAPEYDEIENKIISVSLNAAKERINGSSGEYREILEDLNRQKAAVLASIDKPSDYLEPVYTCPVCHDTGYVSNKKCACFQKKAIDLVYHDSNLKNITENENFDTFSYDWYDDTTPDASNGLTPYHNMQRIVSICHSFVDAFDRENANILFFGGTGTGKTFLSNCIAKALLDSSHSVIYLTAIELFSAFQRQDFSRFGEDRDFDANYLLDCDLLIIDDLGTEVGNTYTNSKLFYVINERMLRKKSTIISTNLSLSDIRDIYSERIFSRITSSYTILKLFGNDIRMMKRTGQKPKPRRASDENKASTKFNRNH